MTIDPEKNVAVQQWMKGEAWHNPTSAEFRQDPDMGFWIWRHEQLGESSPLLAIHEPLVRHLKAEELVATLRLLGVAEEIRRHVKVRVWEGGRVTRY